MTENSRGMYLPRTDGLIVKNITFYNFGGNSNAAF